MADAKLKRKIRSVLVKSGFDQPEAYVNVSDGFDDLIHVVVVSPKFKDLGLMEKTKEITDVLLENLKADEWSRVSLVAGHSPDELKTL